MLKRWWILTLCPLFLSPDVSSCSSHIHFSVDSCWLSVWMFWLFPIEQWLMYHIASYCRANVALSWYNCFPEKGDKSNVNNESVIHLKACQWIRFSEMWPSGINTYRSYRMTWALLDATAVQCASTGHIKMLLKALYAKQRAHEEKTWLCLPRGAVAKRSSRTNVSRHYCMLCLGFCCWEHFLSRCSLQHSRSSQIPNCKSWHFSQFVGILWDVLVGLAMLVRFVVVRNKGRHFIHLRVKAWLNS